MPNTNFSAWLHGIMINHFISSVRNKHEVTDMENMPAQSVSASYFPVVRPADDHGFLREIDQRAGTERGYQLALAQNVVVCDRFKGLVVGFR